MTRDGEITVLPHHIPLVTILQAGELRYKKGAEEKAIAISGGFAEVRSDNTLIILADTAEHAEEINLERAQAAYERAAKLMSGAQKKDDIDYASLKSNLERALGRLKVGGKWRKLPSRKQ